MHKKYDFKGIKKVGAAGILVALNAFFVQFPVLAWASKSWLVQKILTFFLERWVNAAANRGLMLMNLGHIEWDTLADQKAFEKAYDKAFEEIEKVGRKNLTPDTIRSIDDEVIAAYDEFAVFGKLRKR